MQTATQLKAPSTTPSALAKARPPATVTPTVNGSEAPVADTQAEGESRLGHSLRTISVFPSDPPIHLKRTTNVINRLSAFNSPDQANASSIPRFSTRWPIDPLFQAKSSVGPMTPTLQRVGVEEGSISPELEGVIGRARGGGQPLAAGLQHAKGQALGADFSGVRVHSVHTPQLGAAVIQRVNDESGAGVHINWGALTPLEAKAYHKKIAEQGWTATADENLVLTWIMGGRAPGVAPAAYAGLAAAPRAAMSIPGGSFANHAPLGGANAARGKVGWAIRAGAPAPAVARIEAAFREMRNKRSLTKRIFEEERLTAPAGHTPGRAELFGSVEGTAHQPPNLAPAAGKRLGPAVAGAAPAVINAVAGTGYAQLLDALQDEPALLAQTEPFVNGTLVLGAPAANGLTPITDGGVVVGYLTVGAERTYQPAAPGVGGARPLLGKRGRPGKNYVKDNRGTITSRYAYCEKNFWQFMDFLTNGQMEGRFQTFSKAIGDAAPSLFANTKNDVTAGVGAPPVRLTMEQLAVLHQWQGSGPEQRGLSLASTRSGVVLSNQGESFRSAQGFRITIDLSRVPRDVILINHYAASGVRNEMGLVNPRIYGPAAPAPAGGPRYNYTGSVAKNRELFLERLEPAWISQVEWHGAPLAPALLGEPAAHAGGTAGWMAQVQAQTGHTQFVLGFAAMIAARPVAADPLPAPIPHNAGQNWVRNRIQDRGPDIHVAPAPAMPAGMVAPLEIARFGQGVSAARHYLLGHYHGRLRHHLAGLHAAAGGALSFSTVSEGNNDVGNYNAAGGGMEKPPEIYLIGFAHGRSNQPLAGLNPAFLGRGRPFALGSQPAGARGVPVGAGGEMQHQVDVTNLNQQAQTEIDLQQLIAALGAI